MPMTTSTEWNRVRLNVNARRHVILKLTDGSNTWLLGDKDMDLSDGHVHQAILGFSTMHSGFDLYSKKSWLADIEFTLTNMRYSRDDTASGWLRLSDELIAIRGNVAEVYLLLGERMTALSDCLKRFVGVVITQPSYTPDTITVRIVNKGSRINTRLPDTKIGAVYAAAPPEQQNKLIPIVYGDFTYDPSDAGTGLAVAPQIDSEASTKVVISNHVLDAASNLFGKVGQLDEPHLYQSAVQDAEFQAGGTLDDASSGGTYTGSDIAKFRVSIQSLGTPDQFKWNLNGTAFSGLVNCSTSPTALSDGVTVTFGATTGHQIADEWHIHASKVTLNVSDSSRGTAIAGSNFCQVYLFPSGNLVRDTRDGQRIYVLSGDDIFIQQLTQHTQSPFLVSDKNGVTYASIYDGQDNGSSLNAYGLLSFNNFGSGGQFDNDLGYLKKLTAEWSAKLPVGVATVSKGIIIFYGPADADKFTLEASPLYNDSDETKIIDLDLTPPNWRDNIVWHLATGSSDLAATDNRQYPIVFLFELQTSSGNPAADSTIGNQEILRITYLRLNAVFSLRDQAKKYFAECQGREYGSWISSRSSNYSSGAMITDPAGIIESLLRDEIGLVSADLDLPSFIAAENTSVAARINLHDGNVMPVFDVIRQIAEQSTLAFSWGADGIGRCIDLSDKTPTTDRMIPFSHIKDGKITVRKTGTVRNKMNILSRWQEERSEFVDDTGASPVEDTTSQSDVGDTFVYNAAWPNIAGASVITVSGNLVNNTDGLWSKEHTEIEFETLGFLHADLVEGDRIELESDSVDAQVKEYGASWSGKQFTIDDVKQLVDGNRFIAKELWP